MEWGQEQAGLPIDLLSNEAVLLAFKLDSLLDDRHRNLQEGCRRIDNLILMHRTVAILSNLLPDVAHASLSTDDRVTRDPQALGYGISSLKTNAVDVERKAIGI